MPKSPVVGTRPWSSVHLNAIRGAAALIVLLGHTRSLFFSSFTAMTGPTTQATNYIARGNRTTVGEEAVIIFFVLSGYLVGGSVIRSVKNGTWSWKSYLFKRITRLWVVLIPALMFGISLDILGMHLFGSPTSIYAAPSSTLVPHDLAARLSWKVIVANATFLQGILSPTAGTNNSLWSLAYEWWYYLQFPMLVLVFSKSTKPSLRLFYLACLLGSTVFVGREIVALFPTWLLGAAIAALPPTKLSKAVAIPLLTFSISCLVLVKMFDMSKYWRSMGRCDRFLHNPILRRSAEGELHECRISESGRIFLGYLLYPLSRSSAAGYIHLRACRSPVALLSAVDHERQHVPADECCRGCGCLRVL